MRTSYRKFLSTSVELKIGGRKVLLYLLNSPENSSFNLECLLRDCLCPNKSGGLSSIQPLVSKPPSWTYTHSQNGNHHPQISGPKLRNMWSFNHHHDHHYPNMWVIVSQTEKFMLGFLFIPTFPPNKPLLLHVSANARLVSSTSPHVSDLGHCAAAVVAWVQEAKWQTWWWWWWSLLSFLLWLYIININHHHY